MTFLASLPMYDLNPAATNALWTALARRLAQQGLTATFTRPTDLPRHWQDDRLLLSQTCGYPLVTTLSEVQLLGCFIANAPGCEPRHYRSLLVVRDADRQQTLADFRGQRAVANSADSHSGYNALRYVVAPLAQQGRFFSEVLFSGSHRQSLIELQQQRADIAAIDCITFALLQRDQPALLAGLSVIGETPLAPALPLITAASTPAETVAALRLALQQLVDDAANRPLLDALFIAGFQPVSRADYQPVLAWQQQAAAAGVGAL